MRKPDCYASCGDLVNEPVANTTRAALEVARVALGRMMGAPPAPGAPRTVPVTMAVRANDAWKSTEILLRALTARPDLAGQALLTEARRVDKLDMEGMHALVAMREWVERTLAPGSAAQMLTLPPTDAEREVATNALAALDRAMGVTSNAAPFSASAPAVPPNSIPAQPDTGSNSQWAPQAPSNAKFADPFVPADAPKIPYSHARAMPMNTLEDGRAHFTANASADHSSGLDDNQLNRGVGPTLKSRSISSGLIMGVLFLVLVIAGGGAWYVLRGKSQSSSTQQGVDAYARGAKEAARLSFVKAVEENPADARALTYLGRIAREQGSLATSRQYLEKAIRAEPNNAIATRELASALFADAQFELARRFYVRALTLDPADRISQGFLGCSLMKLNRTDEAQRWITRAGAGDWSSCASATLGDPPAKD